ncbi:MAG TPA: hypothetical protein PKC13_19840, partial [Blastocatellia bacterium]|nr:hypothetical protein [Blastocatellia bacterium]
MNEIDRFTQSRQATKRKEERDLGKSFFPSSLCVFAALREISICTCLVYLHTSRLIDASAGWGHRAPVWPR